MVCYQLEWLWMDAGLFLQLPQSGSNAAEPSDTVYLQKCCTVHWHKNQGALPPGFQTTIQARG